MLLAELELFHSRPIAPTRRIALGACVLPCDPAPGCAGVLLGAVAARFAPEMDTDLLADVVALTHEVEAGRRVPQPRLRHRLQRDRIGLARSTHRLFRREDGELAVSFVSHRGAPAQHVLAAVYAAGLLEPPARGEVLAAVRRGVAWTRDIDAVLLAHLSGLASIGSLHADALADPIGWALDVLGLSLPDRPPERTLIQRRFRDALIDAHPDHGGDRTHAARRIADLTEARRILLAS